MKKADNYIDMPFFSYKIVKSPQMLAKVYHLRFQVYINECHYLNDEDYPDKKESDKFDPYSIHFSAIDNEGIVAGALRLVLDSPLGFPMEEHCQDSVHIDGKNFPRQHAGEISRLVISKTYRKRKNDGLYYTADADNQQNQQELKRRLRPMVLGLYKALYQESKRRNITHWYAAMEPCLLALLQTQGLTFQSIGKPIEYYGTVIPYLGIVKNIEGSVQRLRPDYFQYFIEGLDKSLMPASDIL